MFVIYLASHLLPISYTTALLRTSSNSLSVRQTVSATARTTCSHNTLLRMRPPFMLNSLQQRLRTGIIREQCGQESHARHNSRHKKDLVKTLRINLPSQAHAALPSSPYW